MTTSLPPPSTLLSFKDGMRQVAKKRGHELGPWRLVSAPRQLHEAQCARCGGLMHLYWEPIRGVWMSNGTDDCHAFSCDEFSRAGEVVQAQFPQKKKGKGL